MNVQDLAAIGGALGVGSFMPRLWKRLVRDPKGEAEARKLNAEADRTEWETLRDEISRQNEQIAKLRGEVHTLRNKLAAREGELQAENKTLRSRVARLTLRVEGLETILKVTPISKEMQNLLDEIDRKTAEGSGHARDD